MLFWIFLLVVVEAVVVMLSVSLLTYLKFISGGVSPNATFPDTQKDCVDYHMIYELLLIGTDKEI